MNNPNLAVSMQQRRQETISRNKRKREQREYVGNISVRNIVRHLAKLSKEEQEKAETASLLTARYLWNFLSGMTSKHKLKAAA